MKTLAFVTFILVGCASLPRTLPSGLEKAHWGMTESEVMAAFPGQVKRPTPIQDQASSISQLSIERFDFAGRQCSVRFVFSGHRSGLGAIEMRPKESETSSAARSVFQYFEAALVSKYGVPSVSDHDTREWDFADAHIQLRREDWRFFFPVAISYEDPALSKLKL